MDASGLPVVADARAATVSREGCGRLVATGDTPVDDDVVFALIDAGRRRDEHARPTYEAVGVTVVVAG